MHSSRLSLLLVALCAGLAGFLGGRLYQNDAALRRLEARLIPAAAEVPGPAAVTPVIPVGAAPALSIDEVALRREIRQVLQEELRSLDREARVAAENTPKEPQPPSAEANAALRDSHRLLQTAIRAHRWTDRDVTELRALMSQLTEAQRDEVRATLVPAINRGELTMEISGPPF